MEQRSTVIEHLDELRRRIIVALIAIGVAVAVCVPFAPTLLAALKAPASGLLTSLVYFGPEEAFLVYMRVSLIAGLILSFPVIAYEAWGFLGPAVAPRAKRSAASFVAVVSAAFAAGCLFAYAVLLPRTLTFLLSIGKGELVPVISASRYIAFVTSFILVCGVVFQMPVASYFLSRMGLISAGFLRKRFKFAVLGICIAAAVLTPTADAFTMLALALPMLLLYEVSIWVAWAARLSSKKRSGYE